MDFGKLKNYFLFPKLHQGTELNVPKPKHERRYAIISVMDAFKVIIAFMAIVRFIIWISDRKNNKNDHDQKK